MPRIPTAGNEASGRAHTGTDAPRANGRDREDALRRVRRARRHLEPVRPEAGRFAHLKRVYD